MRRNLLMFAVAAAMGLPAGLVAQKPDLGWDAPTFQSPGRHDDLGVYFIRPQHTDWGIAGTWRTGGPVNLGIRGEYVQVAQDLKMWGLGAEAKGGIGPMAPPLAVNWTLGVGALFFEGSSLLSVPVGLTLGVHLAGGGGLVLTPYLHPRIALSYVSPDVGDARTDVLFNTDVGADLDLGGTSPILIRVGGTLGQTPSIGAGLAFKLGRR